MYIYGATDRRPLAISPVLDKYMDHRRYSRTITIGKLAYYLDCSASNQTTCICYAYADGESSKVVDQLTPRYCQSGDLGQLWKNID